ncbi:MAG: hypothetical protein ACW976_07160 [Candidatus Ranarchaeia archaeon]|jgi:hypothetical protein
MSDKKSARLRLVKRPILTGLDDFLRYLLGSESQVDVGVAIIEYLMKNGSFDVSQWKHFTEAVGCSVGMYTRTTSSLKQAGLIERRSGHYLLSRDFVGTLERLMAFWEDVRRKAKDVSIEKTSSQKPQMKTSSQKKVEQYVVQKPVDPLVKPSQKKDQSRDEDDDLEREIHKFKS